MVRVDLDILHLQLTLIYNGFALHRNDNITKDGKTMRRASHEDINR